MRKLVLVAVGAILTIPLVCKAQTFSSTTVTDKRMVGGVIMTGNFDGDGGGDLVSVDSSGNINCIPSNGGHYDLSPIISSVQNPPAIFSYAAATLNPNASDYIILGSSGIANVYSSASCLFTLTQTVIIQGTPTSILVFPSLVGDAGPDISIISGSSDFSGVFESNGESLSPGPAGLGVGITGLSAGPAVGVENFVEPQPTGPLATVSISIWSYANNAWTNTPSVTTPGIPIMFAIAPKTSTAFLVSADLLNVYIQQVESGGVLSSPVTFSVGSRAVGGTVFDGDSLAIIVGNGVQILQDPSGTGNWALGTLLPFPGNTPDGSTPITWDALTAVLPEGFAAQSPNGTATIFKIENGSVVSNASSLAFPSTALGTSSTLPLPVTNTGNELLTTTGVSISGTNGADFSQTNNCTSVQPLDSCTIMVTYTPSAFSAESATLTISSNALNAPTSVALSSAPAPAPIVSVSSMSLDFGSVSVNTTGSKMLTIGNSGTFVLSNVSVEVSGTAFALNNSCPSSLAVLASCSVMVTFTPTVPGNATGTLTIISDASPVTVSLKGSGLGLQPIISSLSPATATSGGPGFTLTVNGSGFVQTSQVSFNLNNVSTLFVNATQLTALIPPTAIAVAGIPPVIVTNSGGVVSVPATFTVNNLIPVGRGVSPPSLPAGGTALTLAIGGTNFTLGSTGLVNGSSRATNYISSTMLQMTLLASDVARGGTLDITISNPPPGGGTTSVLSLIISDYAVTPPATPDSVVAGQPATFVLSVAPSNGAFTDSVTFAVSGLPADATASFSPSSTITPGTTPTNVSLLINTTAHSEAILPLIPFRGVPMLPTLLTSLVEWLIAFVLMLGIGLWAVRKSGGGAWVLQFVLASVILLAVGLTSCGGAGGANGTSSGQQINPTTGTPSGTYTIVVTATSGPVVHTTNVTLTVM